MTNPYADEPNGSVLETTTILSQFLRQEGYSKYDISDIAIGQFLEHERESIKTKASMHLLAIKKSLLYSIPVISPPKSHIGIELTSRVSSPAIQYDSKYKKTTNTALAINDKFRLIGVSFPNKLINHLSLDIFPWRYFNELPIYYTPTPINLSALNGIDSSPKSKIFMINPKHYEDVDLFNQINKYIALAINLDMTPILANQICVSSKEFPVIGRIKPFLQLNFIDKLNKVLESQIDKTYTLSFYEAFHMSLNTGLYDKIKLIGFDSPVVNDQINNLAYIKSQNFKVRANMRIAQHQLLMNTRAEKIAREKYPYFFDFTDRRVIFSRFNRFSIDKLPKQASNEVQILLEKEIASQKALLTNTCEHIPVLKDLRSNRSSDDFQRFERYISYDLIDENKMHSCKLCSYPILCVHEIEFYESMLSIDVSLDNSDQFYWVQQKIINKYKAVDQRRTGDEDTETVFTYYCKYCSGELGKSEDIIQTTIKTQNESLIINESDPIDSAIYMSISSVVSMNMNQSIIPMNKKAITKLIYLEGKDEIMRFVKRATKNEQENIDLLVRYLSMIYGLSALVSININKLKSQESILVVSKASKEDQLSKVEPVSGGVQLKDELIAALKIVQSNTAFKRIGITDDKIKTMLLEAFKFMNKTFANEAIQLKSKTPKERLMLDILSGPIGAYALFMTNLDGRKRDLIDAVGVDFDLLFPKNKKAVKPETHALYSNIYKPKKKEMNETRKYMLESYQSLVDLATEEPIIGRYTSIITSPPSSFVKDYERKRTKQIKLKTEIPYRFLPVENSREYDFQLHNYHIAYCINEDGTIRPHRWSFIKKNEKLIFTCRYCSLDVEKASKTNNDKIEARLYNQMTMEAFFELYTISCPIKDAHTFESDICSKCNVSKTQLEGMDSKYYDKYSTTYKKQRESIVSELIDDINKISKYSTPFQNIKVQSKETKPDLVKLESISSSLSKLYGHPDLINIGMDSTGSSRSLDIIASYVRLFYSHYTFAKNISLDSKAHPDIEFFAFIKEVFFNGAKPKQFTLQALPKYPHSDNPDQLLTELFQIIYDLASNSDADTNILIKFILNKIVQQDSRHKEYNFAKLKSVSKYEDKELDHLDAMDDEENEEEFDIFNGYDIDKEDMEDNIHGDID